MDILIKQDALVFPHAIVLRNGIESIMVLKDRHTLRGCTYNIYEKDTINSIEFTSISEMKSYLENYFI